MHDDRVAALPAARAVARGLDDAGRIDAQHVRERKAGEVLAAANARQCVWFTETERTRRSTSLGPAVGSGTSS